MPNARFKCASRGTLYGQAGKGSAPRGETPHAQNAQNPVANRARSRVAKGIAVRNNQPHNQ